ncbi:MAG TPA: aminomethyltransferase beta-barrel domain-containing protein, partial [Patescibacteria group bacterium]
RLKEKPGMVVNKEGEVIGSHDGVWFYTIGQRGGWEMTPKAQREYVKSGETPVFYVIDKDAKENKLVVGLASQAMEDQFEVREINKISKTKWDFNNLKVRIRHGGELVPSRVKDENGVFTVILDKPLRGIASGQSAVFYSVDDECLGGGIIS